MIDEEQPARRRALSGEPVAETSPAPRPGRNEHTGRFARLEPLDPARHADELWALAGDPAADATWDYLGYGPWQGREQYVAALTSWAASDDPLFFAIRDLRAGRATGVGTLMRITPEARCIEIGHLWFAPAMQRTPVATEAIFLMLRHAFDELGYRRVEWKCNALNAPSRRAAERLGFTFEGVFRQHMVVKGKNRDTAWFAIIDRQWPLVHAALAAWLDPGNFDGEGRQIRRLGDIRASLARP